jgi:hypothetical protein
VRTTSSNLLEEAAQKGFITLARRLFQRKKQHHGRSSMAKAARDASRAKKVGG